MLSAYQFLSLFLIVLGGVQGLAAKPESVFQNLNSERLTVFDRPYSQTIYSDIYPLRKWGLSWSPPSTSQPTQECSKESLVQALADDQAHPEKALSKIWKKCEPSWRSSDQNILSGAIKALSLDFEPAQHPAARVIEWRLSDNTRIKGYLFLKGLVVRPLVILRTGIFSHLRGAVAERFAMMQIFEEGPFHLMVLPSSTGQDFARDNGHISFGGFEEGLHTSEIMDYLNDSKEPLRRLISKVHLVGISLGSHGLWLAQQLENLKPHSLLDRMLLYCPMTFLEESMNLQDRSSVQQFLMRRWARKRESEIEKAMHPVISDSFPHDSVEDSLIERFIQNYRYSLDQSVWRQKLLADRALPPMKYPKGDATNPKGDTTDTISSIPSGAARFWSLNNFWSWLPPLNFEKTFVIWTPIDPIVPPEKNTLSLLNQYPAEAEHFLKLPRGFHCSLSSAYQWPFLSMSLRGFLGENLAPSSPQKWRKDLGEFSAIRHISIKDVSRGGAAESSGTDEGARGLHVNLAIEFQEFFRPPVILDALLPEEVSELQWVFDEWNEELKRSLIRELNSHWSWVQDQGRLIIELQTRSQEDLDVL